MDSPSSDSANVGSMEGADSPASRLLRAYKSRTAFSLSSYLDSKPPLTGPLAMDGEDGMKMLAEWIAKGESLMEYYADHDDSAKVLSIYMALLPAKRDFVTLLRTSTTRASDSIFNVLKSESKEKK